MRWAQSSGAPGFWLVFGLAIAAVIGVTELIVCGSRELGEEVRKLVAEIKKLMIEFHELKQVYVDIGTQ